MLTVRKSALGTEANLQEIEEERAQGFWLGEG
jgi:hypothetical protein